MTFLTNVFIKKIKYKVSKTLIILLLEMKYKRKCTLNAALLLLFINVNHLVFVPLKFIFPFCYYLVLNISKSLYLWKQKK